METLFHGFELEEPGVVPVSGWRPENASLLGGEAWFYAGVGRTVRPGKTREEHKTSTAW
jgi:hypothetical protein